MLQHTVFFYFNDDVTEEKVQQFENGLNDLVAIDAVYKSEICVPGATDSRDVTDHDFGYSIYTWFASMEDYRRYDEHPVHLDFIDTYSYMWANVKMYDSDIIVGSTQ